MLAQRVKACREALGLSQEKLAQQMGMDRNTLWHIEAGKTTQPRLQQMIALALALDVSIDYLAGLTDCPRRQAARSMVAHHKDDATCP